MFKKLLQLKTLLVALLVMTGAGNVWADEVTYTVTSTSAVSISGNAPTGSSAIYSSTYSTAKQLTKGNSMTLTLSGYAGKKITGLVLRMKSNKNGGAGNLSVKAGNTTIASIATAAFNSSSWNNSWSTSYVDKAVTIISNDSYVIQNDEDVVITIEATANSLYCESFKLTYEGGGDTPILETSDLTLSAGSLSFDLYDERDAKTVSYTTSSTGAVTVSGGTGYVNTTVDETNKTITVTPVKITPSAQTITVSQAADGTYYAGTATFTVSVADNTPDPYIWEETGISDLTSSDVFVIVGNNRYNYAMTNDNGTSSAPSAIRVNIEGRKITGTVAENLKWSIAGDATNGYSFCPNGSTTKFLYCNTAANSGSNNNIRVGDGDRRSFVLENNYLKTKDNNVVRYVSVYDDENETSDWRGYVNTATQPTTVKFYKRVDASAPQLSSSNVNIEYNATSGSISYTLVNSVSGGKVTATSSEDWLTVGTITDNSVALSCEANSAATKRVAEVTLTYTYNTNETVTKAVTVTQAENPDAPVVNYASLPFDYDGNGAGTLPRGLTQEGLGTYNSSPRMKFDNTDDYLVLKLNEEPGALSYDIKGNAFSGGTFTVQTSSNGKSFTDLATYTKLDDTQNEFFGSIPAGTRYIKWVYTNKSLGNVALGNIHVAKPITARINAYGYGTFASDSAVMFSEEDENLTAWQVKGVDETEITFERVKGNVAAGTGLLLKGSEGTITVTAANEGEDISDTNKLVGITSATTVEENQYYGLSGNKFVKVNPGTVKAGKALLPVSALGSSSSVRTFTFVFVDPTTGISETQTVSAEQFGEIFNLAGQRVGQPQKGVNIINGKKVLVK